MGHLLLALTLAGSFTSRSYAEQPPAPCHPNPLAAQDEATVRNRGDIVNLPTPLKDRLARLANRAHSQLPTQVYNFWRRNGSLPGRLPLNAESNRNIDGVISRAPEA